MNMQPQPGDVIGWAIVVAGALSTVYSIVASLYWLVRPGEKAVDHAKYLILKENR